MKLTPKQKQEIIFDLELVKGIIEQDYDIQDVHMYVRPILIKLHNYGEENEK